MKKNPFKRALSLLLAAVMCLSVFAGIGVTPALALSGSEGDVAKVKLSYYPSANETNTSGWGHSALTYYNGWSSHASTKISLKALNSTTGEICYCIEPGVNLNQSSTYCQDNESITDYFRTISNDVLDGAKIRGFIGRIMYYGYTGTVNPNWVSTSATGAACIAEAYATQILIWEVIVGERDSDFNHVSHSGYDEVLEVVTTKNPLYTQIMSYYNSIVASIQNHLEIPSFMAQDMTSATAIDLTWDGSKYSATLTDTNNVLADFTFSASISGVSFSVSGNQLTVSMATAPTSSFTISATKNAVRTGVVVWSGDGSFSTKSTVQDLVSYGQEVSDPAYAFVKVNAITTGTAKIVKTSEDGNVEGVKFWVYQIDDDGNYTYNKTFVTDEDGVITLSLTPGTYYVKESYASDSPYYMPDTQEVTVVAGQTTVKAYQNVRRW